MEDVVSAAKGEYTRAKERVVKALNTTPDDKLNWTPNPAARTPLEIGAHCALSVYGIQGMLTGQPFPWESMAAADAAWREMEKPYTTKAAVIELLEKNSAEYIAWLDSLTPEQLGAVLPLPFGPTPMASAITFAADHLRSHAAQIDYIQTTLGDRDWHM